MSINKLFDLTGKTALVTGSSRGIGRSIAITLAEAGAELIIHSRSESSKLNDTVATINNNGGKARAFVADLADAEARKNLIEGIDVLDILILNASTQSYQTIENFTPEEFDFQYSVNLKASFELIKGFVPGMRERKWGRIVSIGSVNQYKPAARLAIYSTTKSAQVNLMVNCSKQYAVDGVTANNIAPGVIQTDRNVEALGNKEMREMLLDMIPARCFGEAEDCAGLALLLCSNAGRYITGADIPVTGGMHQ